MVEVLTGLMIFAAVTAGLVAFLWLSFRYTVDTVDGQDWWERDVR